jgi:hypothetical protein
MVKKEAKLGVEVVDDTDERPARRFAIFERTNTVGTEPDRDVSVLVKELVPKDFILDPDVTSLQSAILE